MGQGTVATRNVGVFAAAMLLVLGAIALLVSAPSPGQAAQAARTQTLAAELNSEVSWGSANGCVQNIAVHDFGAITPNPSTSLRGVFDATPHAAASIAGGNHVWVGCLTANASVGVTAQGTGNMTNGGGDVLPLSAVSIGVTNQPGGQSPAGCAVTAGQSASGGCTLPKDGASRPLITNLPSGTTELDWQYQLDLPANQPSGSYTGGTVVFTATAITQSLVPVVTAAPAITPATLYQGAVASVTTGTWSNTPTSYAYQWQNCNAAGTTCTDIAGATSSTHTVVPADAGFYLKAIVRASNAHGTGTTSVQATTATSAGAPPAVTTPLSVTGDTAKDINFTAVPAGWTGSPTQVFYQWQDCDASGSACTNIAGATGTTYKATTSDLGHTIRLVSAAVNALGMTTTSALATGGVMATTGYPAYAVTVLSHNPAYFFPLNETSPCAGGGFANLGNFGGTAACVTFWGPLSTPGASNGPMLNNNAIVESGGYAQAVVTSEVSGSYTVEEFVDVTNTTTMNNGVAILGTRWPNDFSFDLRIGSVGIAAKIGNGSQWITTNTAATLALSTNRWYHVVATIAKTAGTVTWTYYINGSQVGTGSIASSQTPLLLSSTHHLFMAMSGSTPEAGTFKGKVSDVAVYPTALTAAQVQAHWNAVGTVRDNA
jgi:hypothetical protein